MASSRNALSDELDGNAVMMAKFRRSPSLRPELRNTQMGIVHKGLRATWNDPWQIGPLPALTGTLSLPGCAWPRRGKGLGCFAEDADGALGVNGRVIPTV